ncbi:MAG: lipid-binding SYLF domain-containing protein [Planctomycetota bacterium]|jgi:lipid-binding SYLF domain-containing protein
MNRTHLLGMTLATLAIAACSTAPLSDADKKAQVSQVEATVARFREKQVAVGAYLKTAHAYAVFPTVGKGGIGIGGAFGRGQVFEGGKMIGYCKLTAASIGFQLGGQSFSEMIFFQTEAALSRFKSGEFAFDANASAVAATSGAAAKADYEDGVAVFVMADAGLMYEASIGGQKFDYQAR